VTDPRSQRAMLQGVGLLLAFLAISSPRGDPLMTFAVWAAFAYGLARLDAVDNKPEAGR
jgi:hypothetical protein